VLMNCLEKPKKKRRKPQEKLKKSKGKAEEKLRKS
jgi:hypothetical protein